MPVPFRESEKRQHARCASPKWDLWGQGAGLQVVASVHSVCSRISLCQGGP
jgi:hypothetical protein